jgi:hypothetical protein
MVAVGVVGCNVGLLLADVGLLSAVVLLQCGTLQHLAGVASAHSFTAAVRSHDAIVVLMQA